MTIHRWLWVLALLLPFDATTGLRDKQSLQQIADGRQLRLDRTYRFHNNDLNCVVGQEREDLPLKFFPFEFWYAVETTTDELDFLRKLEAKLFKAVSSHVFWCYGQYSTMHFNGRRLSDVEINQRELEIELARRLGIISVSSGGYDTKYDSTLVYK